MKNALLITFVILGALIAFGQNEKSKKVKTRFLSLPNFDISKTNLSSLDVEFSAELSTYGEKKQRETETPCMPKGGNLKDAVLLKTYYYEVPVVRPNSFLVVKDASGNIIYAEKSSEAKNGIEKFGFQEKCEYEKLDNLKKDWEAQEAVFKGKMEKIYEDQIFKEAKQSASKKIMLSYVNQDFEVYYAKGKEYDYAALDEALEKALTAYEGIAKSGPNEADFAGLKACIAIWEKELENIDLEDKKARITKNIAKGLHENCAIAYMYMYDFENATKHAKEFKALWGNFSNIRSNAFDALMLTMEEQKLAAAKNEELMRDVSNLSERAEQAIANEVYFTKLGDKEYSRLKEEYHTYLYNQRINVVQLKDQENEAAVARGERNPYQKYINVAPTAGPGIMMNMAPAPFNGFPELTEIPKEMCELDLKLLIIRSNTIASVPAEIGNMQNLQKLDLTENKLTTLPPEIGLLKELKTLKLGKNPLESLPSEIADCTNLKTLDLKETTLSDEAKANLTQWLPKCKIKY